MQSIHRVAIVAALAVGCAAEPAAEAPAASASAGAEASPAAPADADQPQDIVSTIVASFDAFNAGDLDGSLAQVGFEARLRHIGGATVEGKGLIRKLWAEQRAAFPDLKRSVRRAIHAGETVSVEYTVTGTQKGEYLGHAAGGKAIGFDALMVFHSAGGHVTEITVYEDDSTLLRQIGAEEGGKEEPVPPAAGTPEIVQGDGDRHLVKFIKAWYGAIGQGWSKACDETYCTQDAVFNAMVTGEVYNTQQKRQNYLDALVGGAKDLEVADVWVEPAGTFFVTFVTFKNVVPSPALGLDNAKKPVSLSVAEIIRMEDGKMKEVFTYFNRREALDQLK